MGTFDPRKVESIEYDFGKADPPVPLYDAAKGEYVDGEVCTVAGTVPEPTDAGLVDFMAAVDEVNADVNAGKATALDSRKRMTDAFVEHLRMPREHLDAIPPRHFREFRDFVVLELLP